MGREQVLILPQLERQLQALGLRIKLARKRRQITILQMAERVGVSRVTYADIEAGKPSISLGHVAKTLQALGMAKFIDAIASDDVIGRELQDSSLLPELHSSFDSNNKRRNQ